MRKLLIFTAVLAVAAFGRQAHLYVGAGTETPDLWDQTAGDAFIATDIEVDGVTRLDGAVSLGDAVGDAITVPGTLTLQAATSFPDGTELLPSITNTGDVDCGFWWSAADTINASAGGVEQIEIDAASVDIVPDTNITGALDVTGDTDLDIVDIDGVFTLPDGLVTAPSWQIESDLQSGPYLNGADIIGWAIAGVNEMDITATGLDIVDDLDVTGDVTVTTDLDVDGDTNLDNIDIDGDLTLPDGLVDNPSWEFESDVDSGPYLSAADTIGWTINGVHQGEITGTGLNTFDIGQTAPGEIDGTTGSFTGDVDFAAGLVDQPSITTTGDLDCGWWWSAADVMNYSAGGVEQLEIDVVSMDIVPDTNITGALDVDGDTDLDDVTIAGLTDIPAGGVGAPSVYITGSATTGIYQSAGDEIAISVVGGEVVRWDGTGTISVGFNGPIGTTVPAAGTFTDVDVGGTFNFGQDPADLIAGYKEIGDYISCVCPFSHGSDAHLAVIFDLTNVVGAGTNTVSGLDGWNQLITGGAGGPDMESTRSNGLHMNAAYAPRIECVVDLGAIAAGQTFFFGFWAAANRFAEIIHEPATGANWLLRVDDTTGAETVDSGVAATLNPTKLAITVSAGGVVDWAIDDVDMATVGLTNLMANDHYIEWRILDVAAAPHTVDIDYYIGEQLKQQ